MTNHWSTAKGDTTLNSHTYAYNPGNQRTQQVFSAGSTYDYTYDPIGQLTIANSGTASEDRGYLYDSAWNLNKRTNNTTVSTFTVDTKNQLTNAAGVSRVHDGNGNVTSGSLSYTYDAENQLVSMSSGTSWKFDFIYDGRGRLRKRQNYQYIHQVGYVPTDYWTYHYDGMRVIQERIGTSPATSYTRGTDLSGTLEGAGGIGGLLARTHGYSGGNWSTHNHYHADGNGNITYMVNSSQTVAASYRYDPHGNTISSSGSLAAANLYRFSSKMIHVESGHYYYGYRWYDPNLQRWLNRDPIEERGGINLYGYVQNHPINAVDPTGLAQICVACNCKGVDLSAFTYVAENEPPNDGPKIPRQMPQPGQCVAADGVYEPGKATKTGNLGSGFIDCKSGTPNFSYNPAPRWLPRNGQDGSTWPVGEQNAPPGWPAPHIPPYEKQPPNSPQPPLDPREPGGPPELPHI